MFPKPANQKSSVQQTSLQLLISSTAIKLEGIPIKDGDVGDNHNNTMAGHTSEDVKSRPADSSEIRKGWLEKLVSKEVGNQSQQAQCKETKDDEVVIADT